MTGNRFKKIAIIGAAGVGKTTLLDAVIASNSEAISRQYTKIPEAVKILCEERGYKSPYDIPAEEIDKFREDVLDRQIELENNEECFIADRSVIDSWVYYMRWSWNSTKVEDAERFYQKAFEQAKNYDLLVYLPIMFEIEDDGFRWKNDTYQKQIDRLLLSVVKDWGLEDKLCKITELDSDARVKKIISVF
jgi:predicted ATPase